MPTAMPSLIGFAKAPWNKGGLTGQKRPLKLRIADDLNCYSIRSSAKPPPARFARHLPRSAGEEPREITYRILPRDRGEPCEAWWRGHMAPAKEPNCLNKA